MPLELHVGGDGSSLDGNFQRVKHALEIFQRRRRLDIQVITRPTCYLTGALLGRSLDFTAVSIPSDFVWNTSRENWPWPEDPFPHIVQC